LRQRSSGNVEANMNGNIAHLRRFRRFLQSKSVIEIPEVVPVITNKRENLSTKTKQTLPAPSVEQVEFYLAQREPMMPEQFGKRKIGKISAALQPVYDRLLVDKRNPNILHWSSVFDSNEEEFDFAQFSESSIRLRDKDRLQLEARRIAERINVEHQRICEALAAI
jgi:hypothetical protein